MNNIGRRGRPLGFKLSDASKKAISLSKKGQKHKPETKDKISKSLILYFRKKNPISEELSSRYVYKYNFDSSSWFEDIRDELDSCMDILTEKALRNKNKIEIACGNNIEYFSHELTPEVIIMFKEYCELNDFDCNEVFSNID